MLVFGGVLDWLVRNSSGSTAKLFDFGGDVLGCEWACDGCINGSGVGGNSDETSFWKEKVAWYGLPDAVLDASEPVLEI